MNTQFYSILLIAALQTATSTAGERILVDFGRELELTSSPDIFAKHWNNLAEAGVQTNSSIVNESGAPTGISIAVTDAFQAVSTNTLGGETIYIPSATGDFAYVGKTTNTEAKLLISGLDSALVYDFKFFVSSNRQSPQKFITDYTVTGSSSETVSLEAIENLDSVASASGIAADLNGEIKITIATAAESSDFGGLGVLEIASRETGDPPSPDPLPIRWSEAGQTPNPPAAPNPTNPEGLVAYVWEGADGYSGYVGAGESLRRAGFHVIPLPLDQPPFTQAEDPENDVDLVLFGAFVSEDPRYSQYMANYGEILDDYVDRAGYLVQLAQADQTEAKPVFLPDTQNAARIDTDFSEAFILSPDHPMVQGFPTNPDGKVFYTQDHIPAHFDDVVWESFSSFAGFEVILAGDQRARFPALMEGAYGQGQLLLASMAPDKIINASNGSEQSDPVYAQFNQAFFNNLYTQTKRVRDRTAPPINITPQPGDSEIPDGAWTIALLPDTQIYSQNRPGVFSAQTAWLRDNASRYNIRFVLHLGDIVNVNSIPEWKAARESMALLDDYIPYAFVPGNHDYGPSGNASTRDTFMNDYFLFSDYSNRPTFGGAMIEGEMDNSYHFFEAGGYKWIVMCLEWGPRDSTITWADSILDQHPDKKAILVTHAFMNNNDLRYDHTDTENPQAYNPHAYSTPGGVNDGEELWQKLVREHDFVLTVNGHVLGDGTGFRTDANDSGQNVHQMLANYQFLAPFGGNGFLRLLTVLPNGTVQVKSYSPIYNEFRSEADQEFEFEFEWYSPADVNENGQPDFFDDQLDSDNDGIDNKTEFVNLRSNPFNNDSDGDGLTDTVESQIGTDPSVSNRNVSAAILNNASAFDLFTEQELIDLDLGQLLISPEAGQFNVDLQLEMTPNLATQPFSPFGEPVEWTIPADGEKAFLRVRANAPEPSGEE